MICNNPRARRALLAAVLAVLTPFAGASAAEPCRATEPSRKKGLGDLLGAVKNLGAAEALGGRTGGFLGGAAKEVAPGRVPCGRAEASTPAASAVSPSPDASAPPAASGPAPWPTNAAAGGLRAPMQLRFSPDLLARKRAYLDFSRYDCSACEGGHGYDAWIEHLVPGWLGNDRFESHVGAMKPGERFEWAGTRAKGVLTVVSEQPVAGFACKQVAYRLTRGPDSAERPGLFCFGRTHQYGRLQQWVEVF